MANKHSAVSFQWFHATEPYTREPFLCPDLIDWPCCDLYHNEDHFPGMNLAYNVHKSKLAKTNCIRKDVTESVRCEWKASIAGNPTTSHPGPQKTAKQPWTHQTGRRCSCCAAALGGQRCPGSTGCGCWRPLLRCRPAPARRGRPAVKTAAPAAERAWSDSGSTEGSWAPAPCRNRRPLALQGHKTQQSWLIKSKEPIRYAQTTLNSKSKVEIMSYFPLIDPLWELQVFLVYYCNRIIDTFIKPRSCTFA